MREIKFRAWVKDAPMCYEKSGMFYQEDQYLSSFLRRIYDQYVTGHPSSLKFQLEERLMMFTGFKDVHGKDIYEGDFLAVDWNDQRYPPHTIGPVEWNEDEGCWELGEGGCAKTDAQNHMEVIGNIYQNPELMK